MIVQTCRVLLNVADIETSLGFWRDLIGFEVVDRFDHEGAPVFASVRSGDVQLMLNARGGDPAPRLARPRYTEAVIYLGVESVHDLVRELRGKGCEAPDPEPQDYGVDEITLRDPDGYEIAFTSPRAGP
ncbi:MAG TPA: glyoxalase superfamily protein [Caulobacteraceae bacterium]|jgi:catechol 2,3-dioxygenase|nr:glyoxalase superfamily protein [Caulobacteraceae bacterium]